jgi:hypothetical protein
MQVIEFNNTKYNVPTSWNEVSTGTYIKLTNMVKMFQDEEGNLTVSDELLFPRIAEIMTGIGRLDIPKLSYVDVTMLSANLKFLNVAPNIQTRKVTVFKYGNYIFKIKDFDNLTFGEFIDTQHLRELGESNIIKAMANLVDVYEQRNILKFKFKQTKLDLTLDEKERLMNEVSCLEFSNLSFFLLNGFKRYMRSITRSLEIQALRLNMKQILPSLGLIISGLWIWLTKRPLKSKTQS